MFNADGSIQEIAIVKNYELSVSAHITFGLSVDIWKHTEFNGKDVSYFWSHHISSWQAFEMFYTESDEIFSTTESCLIDLLANARRQEIKDVIFNVFSSLEFVDEYLEEIAQYERDLI